MSKFSIIIPCKTYSKRFLELNYGNPVDFTKDKTIYPEFRKKLQRQNNRYEKRYQDCSFSRYIDSIEVKITRDDFYRFGWELTKTDLVSFNREIESRAKIFMYVIVSTRMAFGMSMTDSIAYFQDAYDFPEDIWAKESIVKDCQRNLSVTKNEILNNISSLIDKLSLAKLSVNETISHNFRKSYEKA
ncbi:MAG: hypothetical protein PHU68_01130 [Paludibacter sp.]|nr:hypothetical protein [Paludibacter sp.]